MRFPSPPPKGGGVTPGTLPRRLSAAGLGVLMIEQELARVQQRPQEVLYAVARVRRLADPVAGPLHLLGSRRPRQRDEVQLLDHRRLVLLRIQQRVDAALGVGQPLVEE